jgi:hypothetical protein
MQSQSRVRLDRPWYRLVDPVVRATSATASLFSAKALRHMAEVMDPRDHEGHHRVADPRYKEWWYFDAHLADGRVLSLALVFSIVRTHYFLWLSDPTGERVSLEIERDGPVYVAPADRCGKERRALLVDGECIRIYGDLERGYVLSFRGRSTSGELHFFDPAAPRAEVHRGTENTLYGLYQSPRLRVRGNLIDRATGIGSQATGVGYHDHWWGIAHRITRWRWLQVKLENDWTVGFYEGRYGRDGADLHRYAWLHRPDSGYADFDLDSLTFDALEPKQVWRVAATGPAGKISLEATRRLERYQYKSVEVAGIRVGEVDYFQYPITAVAVLEEPAGARQVLTGACGMLEWDWLALW